MAKRNVISKDKKKGEKVNILDQGRIGFLHSFPIHRSQTISAWKEINLAQLNTKESRVSPAVCAHKQNVFVHQ